MRNAIPIGFVILVAGLYFAGKDQARRDTKPLKNNLSSSSVRKAPVRSVTRAPAARRTAKKPSKFNFKKNKRFQELLRKALQKQRLRQARLAMQKKAKQPTPAARPAARPATQPPARPTAQPAGGSVVQLQTSMGNIELQLYPQKAPKTVANFIQYVKSGHYDGTIFHRVIPRFMIQGGGLTPKMTKKPTRAPIQNEADNGLKNELGTVAMARTSAPHSASAQFFINTKNNSFLNFRSKSGRGWGYCVFGKVIKGMDVVMKISGTKTGIRSGRRNVPLTPIMIKKAVLLK